MTAIGGHASIRDTSELMAVKPEGIRHGLLGDNRRADFSQVGANGVSGWASVAVGREMLRLKIEAGVGQIEGFVR